MKRFLFFFLALLVFSLATIGTVPQPSLAKGNNDSPSYDAVPKDYQGYVPDAPSEKITSTENTKKDNGNIATRFFAKIINGFSSVVQWVLTGDASKKADLSSIIFGKVNPINGKTFDTHNVGHIFSAAEWNKAINPLRIALTFVAWAFFAVIVAFYGIKLMAESTNPLKRSNLQERLYAWIGAGAMLAFMYMIVFIIFNLNYAFVHGLWNLIGSSKTTNSAFDALSKPAEGGITGGPIGDSLLNFAMVIMTAVLLVQYIFRKFIIAVLIVISPMAAIAFAKNKDGMAFKMWISELLSQVFIQTGHAIVIVLYLAFVNASVKGSNGIFGDQGLVEGNVGTVINPILHFLIAIGGVIAVGALTWNGIRLSASGGNPQARASALKGIQMSLIGCLLCVGSVMVVNLIRGLMF